MTGNTTYYGTDIQHSSRSALYTVTKNSFYYLNVPRCKNR